MNGFPIKFEWTSVRRDQLARALVESNFVSGRAILAPLSAADDEVVLGQSTVSDEDGDSFLGMAILPNRPRELLSWLLTYAEEVFPISQYCRVLTAREWSEFEAALAASRVLPGISPLWPSIVVGEMLGQSGFDGMSSAVPTSRASACLSFAFARTSLLYPDLEGATSACIERLVKAENEARFGRRHITVTSLKKVWASALALEQVPHAGGDTVELLMQTVAGLNSSAFETLRSADGLFSDSAESRVVAFDNVVDSLFQVTSSDTADRSTRALTLSAACLLAGRGTSHVGLLAGPTSSLPETMVYFGLLAGVLGPACWDKVWTQQAKGVERGLRQFFRVDEPLQADLCWSEFDWLSETFSAVEVLGRLPRANASGLSIELLPGVVCQFRLADHGASGRAGGSARPSEVGPSDSTSVLSPNVAAKAKRLLGELQDLLAISSSSTPPQGTLFETAQPERASRTRNKSGRRGG